MKPQPPKNRETTSGYPLGGILFCVSLLALAVSMLLSHGYAQDVETAARAIIGKQASAAEVRSAIETAVLGKVGYDNRHEGMVGYYCKIRGQDVYLIHVILCKDPLCVWVSKAQRHEAGIQWYRHPSERVCAENLIESIAKVEVEWEVAKVVNSDRSP